MAIAQISSTLPTASANDLLNEGFPANHVQAFLEAAKTLSCIILTRTPGQACAGPLSEGYDAKSFHVKAKSCNFGVAAGFVCFDPLLNKNGINGAAENLDCNIKSISHEYDYISPQKQNTSNSSTAPEIYKSDIIQLHISDNRIEDLIKNKKVQAISEASDSNNIYKTITFGFDARNIHAILVKPKNSNISAVFYDMESLYLIGSIDNKSRSALDLGSLFFNALQAKVAADKKSLIENNKDSFISQVNKEKGRTINGSTIYYYPLMVMTNPQKSYTDSKFQFCSYLNALTGDYDLFAVWPQKVTEEDTRVAGMSPSIKDSDIKNLESQNDIGKVFGNISERIFMTAQTINSNIQEANPGQLVNRVYHSDEAGRPGVETIDDCVAFTPDGKAYILTAATLKTFIKDSSKAAYHIIINKGWMSSLSISPDDTTITWSESLLKINPQ